jgi:hypothetical protein
VTDFSDHILPAHCYENDSAPSLRQFSIKNTDLTESWTTFGTFFLLFVELMNAAAENISMQYVVFFNLLSYANKH